MFCPPETSASPGGAPSGSPAPDDRRPVWVILALSAVALAGLFHLIYLRAEPETPAAAAGFLPAFNAACNAFSALAVLAGLAAIRRGARRRHALCMGAALAGSAAFLAGYLLHHWWHGDTPFRGQGWVRPLYFSILISHILVSVAVLPLVLLTVYRALRGHWTQHRALARWTYPAWLYVSGTGILVFLFLRFT